MRYFFHSVSFLLLLSLFAMLTGFSFHESKLKATWIWQTDLIASEPDEILSFAKQEHVSLVYVQIDKSRQRAFYQSFIKKAHEADISVHALGGDPGWGLEQNRPKIETLINWVHAYNQGVADDEKFDGIHLDIEPYLLPAWKTEQQSSIILQWMGNVDAYVAKAKQDPALEIGCDIPFWLDKYTLPGDAHATLSHRLISKHDQAAVMAYRDRGDGSNSMSQLAAEELREADLLGKKILIAAETKQSSEGDYVSFYEEGKAYMNAELSKLPELLAAHPSFTGIAIHSYGYWKLLKD